MLFSVQHPRPNWLTMNPKAERSGKSNADVRRQNLSSVIRQVHYSISPNRSRIAAQTGLNRSTVLDLLNTLEQRGLVTQSTSSNSSDIGRPSITVTASNKIVSFAVLPRLSELNLAAVGLGGTILTKARLPLKKGSSPEIAAALACNWINTIRHTLPAGTMVSGVGLAAAGPVSMGKGEIRLAPSLGWQDAPFRDLVANTLDFRVEMDNDAGLWCAAEQRFGVGRGHKNMLLLIGVNGGVGGGAVVNGEMVRGHDGYAGEFGHMRISDKAQLDYSGIPGTLEAMVRREDIVEVLGLGEVDDEQLAVIAAESKSRRLERLLSSQTHYLGRAIGTLVSAFNPEIIVLAGFLELFPKLRGKQLRSEIKSQALGFASENLKLVTGTRGNDLLLVGAAELGFRDLLDNPLESELAKA